MYIKMISYFIYYIKYMFYINAVMIDYYKHNDIHACDIVRTIRTMSHACQMLN